MSFYELARSLEQSDNNGIDPYVEHDGQHSGLLLQVPNDGRSPHINRSNQLGVLAVAKELLENGIEHVDLLGPQSPSELQPLFDSVGLRPDDGQITFLPVPSRVPKSAFLRDEIFLGTHDGLPAIATSLVRSVVRHISPQDISGKIASLQRRLQATHHMLPLFVENGNVIPTRSRLLMLRDPIGVNQAWLTQLRGRNVSIEETKRAVRNALCPSDNKSLVVLDESLGHRDEDEQTIFHLDLAISVVSDAQNQEHILISSPRLARKLLVDNGLLTPSGHPVNPSKWMEAQNTTHLLPPSLRALRSIGEHLTEYFHDANYIPLVTYLDLIEKRLIALGYSGRIHEVPALLWASEYQSVDSLNPLSPGRYSAPFYAPTNAIPYNYDGKRKRYITGGGITLFDTEIARIVNLLGIQHVPITSLLDFGAVGSWLRCLGFAVSAS